MNTPRNIILLFIVLSISIYCTNGVPTEENTTETTEKLTNANNEFAIKLHQSLAENSYRNIFFSPISLFFALGMLYVGAQGKTAQELRVFLGYRKAGLSDEEIDNSFSRLLTETFTSSKDFTLKTANAILVDQQLNLTSDYIQAMDFYKANVYNINFHRRNRVLRDINGWVRNQTDGKIKQFLEDLDPSTVMLILNAVYFKGLWATQFKKQNTIKDIFYSYGGEVTPKSVDMMQMSHKMLHTSSPDWEMVELPYKGDRISMVIVLPKERNGLAAVEKNLTSDDILRYRRKMRLSTVNITLPKFKIEYPNSLNQHLFDMGLQKIFQYDADFSGMVHNGPVRVSRVMQKALVEVNEEGTVAAAVTGVHIVPLSLSIPRVFKVDHPFFFAILDKRANLILFTGRVIFL